MSAFYLGAIIDIPCADGVVLRGRVFEAEAGTRRDATVIVAPAMLVRQRFYAAFGEHLASAGIRTVTFDQRGVGDSLAIERQRRGHRLRDWGERDLPALIGWAHATRPEDRLLLVGHSMGGQIAALSRHVHELDGLVTVAATAAYWGHWPSPNNVGILAWYHVIPVVGRLLPVFPAERLGVGPDTHSKLVRDWARWGRHPEYLEGPFGHDPQMASYRGRVRAYSFTDDRSFGCREAVEALHRAYRSTDVEHRHVDPADIGARQVGHFGFFRRGVGEPLWDEVVDWIGRSVIGES